MTNAEKRQYEEMYRDQSPRRTNIYDRQLFSSLTPHGIRLLDTLFANRIRSFKRGESYIQYVYISNKKEIETVWNDTKESLIKDIKENIHLHKKIKENLLYNLNMI